MMPYHIEVLLLLHSIELGQRTQRCLSCQLQTSLAETRQQLRPVSKICRIPDSHRPEKADLLLLCSREDVCCIPVHCHRDVTEGSQMHSLADR